MGDREESTAARYLVSACLAGFSCRYDGRAKTNRVHREEVERGTAIPACAEGLGGLAAPRPAAEIDGGDGDDVLEGRARVIDEHGEDVSAPFIAGAHEVLDRARRHGIDEAVLIDRSPSCGATRIYDGRFEDRLVDGRGVTAALLARHGLRITTGVPDPEDETSPEV